VVILSKIDHRWTMASNIQLPKGLRYLFAASMFERLAYYGVTSLFILYCYEYLFSANRVESVLGYVAIKTSFELVTGPLNSQQFASVIFGSYSGMIYLTTVLGGLVADRILGQRGAVLIGATILTIGYLTMAIESTFFLALVINIVGMGIFKPSVATQVGNF